MKQARSKSSKGKVLAKNDLIKNLIPIEEYINQISPLPIWYDLNRPQPWYFTEFSYTEFMGGLFISPMSDEIACKIVQQSMRHSSTLNVENIIYDRLDKLKSLDKYALDRTDRFKFKEVVILPGSNILRSHVSRELLTKLMWERQHVVIKTHPLTSDADLNSLKKDFGVHRVINPDFSGWDVIKNAEIVYSTSSTELAAYACFFGKKVISIGNFFFERTGSYYPMFRMFANTSPKLARKNLLKILISDRSGLLQPEDPEFKSKADNFFTVAMKYRKMYTPLLYNSFAYPNYANDPDKSMERPDHGIKRKPLMLDSAGNVLKPFENRKIADDV